MCQGGNSRSVACAFVLKYRYGLDALACGWEKNSTDTLNILFEWSDAIIVMEPHFVEYVPAKFKPKVFYVNVGPDIWFNSLHPDLVSKCEELLKPMVKYVDTAHA